VNHLLLPLILLDLVAAVIVVVVVHKLRNSAWLAPIWKLASSVSPDQMRALEAFSREQHQRIAEYMRASWSGIPDQLPGVLTALLDEMERTARARSLPLERDVLKTMLASSLTVHRIAKGSERNEAFKRVA